ncbi:MAG: hypothetical protein IJ615_11895 [Bacteroidaceae bacterium]|nr:hypothetical protein [Bacteroidaceae bacterium]
MKKTLLTGLLLLTALVAGAQTKIAPKMQKGMQKVYVAETTTNIAGQKSITMTVETQYTVTDATADGYVMDVTVTDVQTDADKNDMVGRIVSLSMEMLKNVKTTLATDKDGKVTKILNFEDVKNGAKKVIDKVLAEVPATPGISTDILEDQIMGQLTEKAITQQMQMNSSPLALNGKTVSSGMEDEYLNQQGLKMKRTYSVGQDGTIQTNSTIDMTPQEMKQMIIDQVEKLMPAQADMIRQNIDAVLSTGMMKFKMDVKDVYTFQADGWVSGVTSEANNDTMGQKTTVKSTVRIKQ